MVAAGLSVYGTIATVYSVGDVTTQVVNAAPQDRLQVAGSGYGGVAGSVGGGVAGLSAGAFLFPALFTGPIGALGAGFVFTFVGSYGGSQIGSYVGGKMGAAAQSVSHRVSSWFSSDSQ